MKVSINSAAIQLSEMAMVLLLTYSIKKGLETVEFHQRNITPYIGQSKKKRMTASYAISESIGSIE
jgi:hypothetical protein